MKYFIIAISLLVFLSCKKKEHVPVTNTQTEEEFNYQGILKEDLILTRNSGGFDTTFSFSGTCLKIYSSHAVLNPFISTNFNGHTADASNNFNGTINNFPNFMQLANRSTWNVISTELGNFQYIDSFPMPKVSGASITIPATFDAAQGIPISISGIQNGGFLSVINIGENYFFLDTYNQLRTFQVSGVSVINDTIFSPNFAFIPTNTTLTLSIEVGQFRNIFVNGHNGSLTKRSSYNYFTTKKIN